MAMRKRFDKESNGKVDADKNVDDEPAINWLTDDVEIIMVAHSRIQKIIFFPFQRNRTAWSYEKRSGSHTTVSF